MGVLLLKKFTYLFGVVLEAFCKPEVPFLGADLKTWTNLGTNLALPKVLLNVSNDPEKQNINIKWKRCMNSKYSVMKV